METLANDRSGGYLCSRWNVLLKGRLDLFIIFTHLSFGPQGRVEWYARSRVAFVIHPLKTSYVTPAVLMTQDGLSPATRGNAIPISPSSPKDMTSLPFKDSVGK